MLQDLTLAVRELVRPAAAGQLSPQDVTPDAIAAQLATRQLPAAWREPDLVIRTSGEQRLSNFMCWEAAYAGGLPGWLCGGRRHTRVGFQAGFVLAACKLIMLLQPCGADNCRCAAMP